MDLGRILRRIKQAATRAAMRSDETGARVGETGLGLF